MNKEDTEKITSIADSIKRYLITRPQASETVEGVAKWWLIQQRFNDSLEQVQVALEYLEKKGEVERVQLPDGREVFKNTIKVTQH